MSRTPAFQLFAHTMRQALATDQEPLPAPLVSRRHLLTAGGKLAAAGVLAAIPAAGAFSAASAAPKLPAASVGIVGAGLAGLVCADHLQSAGMAPHLYDAAERVGGRVRSLAGFFPAQVAERGGEFIDTGHKTMIAYARQFGLTLEDVNKEPGDVAYYLNGRHYPESAVVDEFRAFVAVMRSDLRTLSRAPSAISHTPADAALDRVSLAEYLDGRNALRVRCGPIARAAIEQAYLAEYGREIGEQSCLNFLLFIHADRRSKFTPFGVFSDERYHVVEGNERIVTGLAARLVRPPAFGRRLLRVRALPSGRIELTFAADSRTETVTHDMVVLTLPFSVLRGVELAPSLGLSPDKLRAIRELGYGDNAKTMIGFTARPWRAQGKNGSAYAGLPHLQTTWETNPAGGAATRGILTDYSGGRRGATLHQTPVQQAVADTLRDLDRVFPGAQAAAAQTPAGYLAFREHWPSNPLTLGGYTCYLPGQFTTIAGLEGQPAGNLLFAGEHTNSFYEWQGFMEGAALSGIQVAADVIARVVKR